MRIGFDVTPLCVPRSGVGTYTANLLAHLLARREDEIVPLAHCWPLDPRDGSAHHTAACADLGALRGQRVNKTLWMQVLLPCQLARLGVKVGHFTNSVAPLFSPCPTVVTIHDMTLWLLPQYHYGLRLLSMRPFIPLAARRAAAIIAVSHATRDDIVRILGVPVQKIHVIHEAPAPCFRPLPQARANQVVRLCFKLPERFALYVGTIEPRKNLVRLLEAFAPLWHGGAIRHGLVFVGSRGWKEEPVFAAVERLGLEQAVHFLGHVSTETLVHLYNAADALVFPSLYEGFGLPVVEAMACGTPVVTSRNGSLGEIAGQAAEFVEPTSVESIAVGLRRALTDAERRAELRERGLVQAARFSWRAAAAQTRAVYELGVSKTGKTAE